MSLQTLADQMKSRGRNGDTELVHMTKGEVAGLQQLAMAAGGSLTINPDTGLPEASFLRQLLPTIIGVGLAPFTGGMSAAAVGAGAGALLNEDDPLMGAITGGLGAFGGASLGAGLGAAGGAGAAQAAGSGAIGQGASLGAAEGLKMGATQSLTAATPGAATGSQYALAGGAPSTYSLASGATPMATAPVAATTAPTTYGSMYEGIGALGNQAGRGAFMDSVGGGAGLLRSGTMAGAPLLMPAGQRGEGMPMEEEDTENVFDRYEYDPGYTGGTRGPTTAFTGERNYFDPRFRLRAAQGGAVKKFADGGEASASSSEVDPARGMTGMSREAMLYLYGMGADPSVNQFDFTNADHLRPVRTPVPEGIIHKTDPVRNSGSDRATTTSSMFGNVFSRAFAPLFGTTARQPEYIERQDGYLFDPVSQEFIPNVRYEPYRGYAEGGGIADLAQGGMKAGGFVVPADVVSLLGEGNTEAGYATLEGLFPEAVAIRGQDGGQADTVETSIEGEQPAAVAHGEVYLPPEAVKKAGGAKKLYAMMDNVRKQAMGTDRQIRPVDPSKAFA